MALGLQTHLVQHAAAALYLDSTSSHMRYNTRAYAFLDLATRLFGPDVALFGEGETDATDIVESLDRSVHDVVLAISRGKHNDQLNSNLTNLLLGVPPSCVVGCGLKSLWQQADGYASMHEKGLWDRTCFLLLYRHESPERALEQYQLFFHEEALGSDYAAWVSILENPRCVATPAFLHTLRQLFH